MSANTHSHAAATCQQHGGPYLPVAHSSTALVGCRPARIRIPRHSCFAVNQDCQDPPDVHTVTALVFSDSIYKSREHLAKPSVPSLMALNTPDMLEDGIDKRF